MIDLNHKTMKTPTLIALLFTLLFLSCTDETTTGTNNSLGIIEALIDGNLITNSTTPASIDIDSTRSALFVVGLETEISPGSPTLSISISYPNGEPLEEGQYIFDDFDSLAQLEGVFAALFYNTGVSLFSAPIGEGRLELNIESLDLRSGGHIEGTFSGTLIDDETDELISVENGLFNSTII